MSTFQVGNGYFNDKTWRYTTYDSNTGQLTTRSVSPNGSMSPQQFISQLQNGQIDINKYFRSEDTSNYLGGRSNVNVSRQVARAFDAIKQKYPQMPKEQIAKYAQNWVNERVSKGWDANEVENMMKDITRGDDTINNDFLNGVVGNISYDEYNATPDDATGASANTDPNAGRGSIQDELRAFAGRMMSVLPPDSPQVQRIAELAAQAGNKYATASGLGPGGITTTGVANTAARANVDLQTQRESIGAQALATAGNQQLTVDAANTQLQQLNQQAANSQVGGVGGLVGSAAGLVAGGVATAYGANPSIIPGLMQGGGSYGSGIAQLASNGSQGPLTYGGGQGAPQSTYKGRSWGTS